MTEGRGALGSRPDRHRGWRVQASGEGGVAAVPVGRALWRALVIALHDLWHDRRTSAVLVLTAAAIIAPLLLLFGLKNGVVWTLRQDLLQDPANLEVVVYGSTRLERAWFDAYAARPEVGFVLPKTRTINATLDLVNERRRAALAVEVVPTAAGDPLLGPGLPSLQTPLDVLVTATLARRLELSPDAPLYGVVKRHHDGRPQHARFALNLVGVVPETRLGHDALFTTLDLLVALEDYRDGLLDDPGEPAALAGRARQRERFANARVYAADLDAVAPLAALMRADGIEVRTRAGRIATVQAFDRLLSFVFRVIAAIGTLGCALALGGALWVNVERKRRDLALLRLFGFGHGAIALVPVLQSVAIALGGFALAYGVYLLGAGFFNRMLGANLGDGGYACRLDWQHLSLAAGITLSVALLAALAGALRASRIDPAESLREL